MTYKVYYPNVFKALSEIEIRRIDEYLNILTSGFFELTNEKREELTNDYVKNDPEYQDTLSDELNNLEDVFKYGELLLILGLYRSVELIQKNIFIRYVPGINERSLSYFKNLSTSYNNVTHKNIADLPFHESVNELRLINNCIKHSGKVDDDLSNYNGWVEGQEIVSVKNKYNNLKKDIPKYLYDLADSFEKA